MKKLSTTWRQQKPLSNNRPLEPDKNVGHHYPDSRHLRRLPACSTSSSDKMPLNNATESHCVLRNSANKPKLLPKTEQDEMSSFLTSTLNSEFIKELEEVEAAFSLKNENSNDRFQTLGETGMNAGANKVSNKSVSLSTDSQHSSKRKHAYILNKESKIISPQILNSSGGISSHYQVSPTRSPIDKRHKQSVETSQNKLMKNSIANQMKKCRSPCKNEVKMDAKARIEESSFDLSVVNFSTMNSLPCKAVGSKDIGQNHPAGSLAYASLSTCNSHINKESDVITPYRRSKRIQKLKSKPQSSDTHLSETISCSMIKQKGAANSPIESTQVDLINVYGPKQGHPSCQKDSNGASLTEIIKGHQNKGQPVSPARNESKDQDCSHVTSKEKDNPQQSAYCLDKPLALMTLGSEGSCASTACESTYNGHQLKSLSSALQNSPVLTENSGGPSRSIIGDRRDLSSWGLPEPVLEAYKSQGVSTMFEWQAECLLTGNVLDGGNLVYSAPTSAGKTLVAELVMLKRVLESRKKALFVLPYVSVAREKMYSLQRLYQDAGIRVGGYMGSHTPPGGFSNVHIAVCTIERGNGLINRLMEEKNLGELGVVVIDELHMVGDSHRGYLLELMLTKLAYVAKRAAAIDCKIQIIGMSATLPNLPLLAQWLDASLYCTHFRPVPLTEYIKIDNQILNAELNFEREVPAMLISPADDADHVIALCVETVRDGHGVLVFCPTKNWCEKLCEAIARRIYFLTHHKDTGDSAGAGMMGITINLDKDSLIETSEQLRRSLVGLDPMLGRCILNGVAYHHAGLTFEERDIIEGAFRLGHLKVLVATSTLSSGVNLPARRVIIRSPVFFGKAIDTLTYKQMVGRAGRKGIDTEGESILICKPQERNQGKALIMSSLPPVESCLQFSTDYGLNESLKRAILEVVVSEAAETPEDLVTYISCTLLSTSLAQVSHSLNADLVEGCIQFLTEKEFIRVNVAQKEDGSESRKFVPTQLGTAILASSLSPGEGLKVFAELQKARRAFVLDTELHIVYFVTPIHGSDLAASLDWYQYHHLWERLAPADRRVADLVGVTESFIARAIQGHINGKTEAQRKSLAIHQRFYTALVLNCLVQEMPLMRVATQFNCNKGQLQSLQQAASTYAGMVTVFCERLGWHTLALILSQFNQRLSMGVQQELVDLVRISSLNATSARMLYNGGYHTVTQVAKAEPTAIENLFRNAVPFQSEKKQDEETEWEKKERQRSRCIWLLGKKGVTEMDAAVAIIEEAKIIVQGELGVAAIAWGNPGSEENISIVSTTHDELEDIENKISDFSHSKHNRMDGSDEKNPDVSSTHDRLEGSEENISNVSSTPNSLDCFIRESHPKDKVYKILENLDQSDREIKHESPKSTKIKKWTCLTGTNATSANTQTLDRNNVDRQEVSPPAPSIYTNSETPSVLLCGAQKANNSNRDILKNSPNFNEDKPGEGCFFLSYSSLSLTSQSDSSEANCKKNISLSQSLVLNSQTSPLIDSEETGHICSPVVCSVLDQISSSPEGSSTSTNPNLSVLGVSPSCETTCRENMEVSKGVSSDPFADSISEDYFEEYKNNIPTQNSQMNYKLPDVNLQVPFILSKTSENDYLETANVIMNKMEDSLTGPLNVTTSVQRDKLEVITVKECGGEKESATTDRQGDNELCLSLFAGSSFDSVGHLDGGILGEDFSSFLQELCSVDNTVETEKNLSTSHIKQQYLNGVKINSLADSCSDHFAETSNHLSKAKNLIQRPLDSPIEIINKELSPAASTSEMVTDTVAFNHATSSVAQNQVQLPRNSTPLLAVCDKDQKNSPMTSVLNSPAILTLTDRKKIQALIQCSDLQPADLRYQSELERFFNDSFSPLTFNSNLGETKNMMEEENITEIKNVGEAQQAIQEQELSKNMISTSTKIKTQTVITKLEGSDLELLACDVSLTSTADSRLDPDSVHSSRTDGSDLVPPTPPDESSNPGLSFKMSFTSPLLHQPKQCDFPTTPHRETSRQYNTRKQGRNIFTALKDRTSEQILGKTNKNEQKLNVSPSVEQTKIPRNSSKAQTSMKCVTNTNCVQPIATHKIHNQPFKGQPVIKSNGPLLAQHHLNITDVCASKELFLSFISKLRSKTHISISIACEKKTSVCIENTGLLIGGKFLRKRKSPETIHQPPVGMTVPGSDVVVLGLAFCWESKHSYYLSLRSAKAAISGKSVDSLYGTAVEPALSPDERIKSLAEVLCLNDNKGCKKKVVAMYDCKTAYVYLAKTLGLTLAFCEDVCVAEWLMDPSSGQSSVHQMVMKYCPEQLDLLSAVGGGRDCCSLGCDVSSGVDGRSRACTESLLVHELMLRLRGQLQQESLLTAFTQVEMPSLLTMARMELNGIGVDEREIEKQWALITNKLHQLEELAHKMAGGIFSLTSRIEVARVLYSSLKLPINGDPTLQHQLPTNNQRRKSVAMGSTSKKVLGKLGKLHPLPAVILEWRRLNSALTKSLVPLKREAQPCSRLDMVRVFGECQFFSETGRVNMAEPNLQSIPKDFVLTTSELRDKAVVSSVGADRTSTALVSLRTVFIPFTGGLILTADYTQLELRIIAHLSGDSKLISILNTEEGDVFKLIASQLHQLDIGDISPEQRQQAKQVCYGIIYGMGARALAEQLEIDDKTADIFIESFKSTYPGIRKYLQKTVEFCQKTGYVKTLYHRRRYLPSIKSSNPNLRAQAERQAVNTTVQGSAADLVKLALTKIDHRLTELFPDTRMCHSHRLLSTDISRERGLKMAPVKGAFLVLQLHDELIYEVSADQIVEVARLVKHHMEAAVKLDVCLPVKVKVGPSWGQVVDYEVPAE